MSLNMIFTLSINVSKTNFVFFSINVTNLLNIEEPEARTTQTVYTLIESESIVFHLPVINHKFADLHLPRNKKSNTTV